MCVFLIGCIPKKTLRDDGPFPCEELDARIKIFKKFDEFLQHPETKIFLREAASDWHLEYLERTAELSIHKGSLDPNDQYVYNGRFLEGYPAAKEWYQFEIAHSGARKHTDNNLPLVMYVGKYEVPQDKFRLLRLYEAESNCGAGIKYEEPLPRFVSPDARNASWNQVVRFVMIAYEDGQVLDVRFQNTTKKEVEQLKNAPWERVMLMIQDIVNALFGNGPANAVPSPVLP